MMLSNHGHILFLSTDTSTVVARTIHNVFPLSLSFVPALPCSQFTSKLEGMFNDVSLSKELMAQYDVSPAAADLAKRSVGGGTGGSLPKQPELYVHVLTSSYWPIYTPAAVQLPPDLTPCLETFSAFYNAKYSKGRKLTWQHNLGHCIIKATFPGPGGRKELDVSFFQALVLLLFNGADALCRRAC